MGGDILKKHPALFLGSRLKRLAERMQADVAQITFEAGIKIHPSQYALLATLDLYGPQTIGELTTCMALSQPAITRTVTKLSQAGLVAIDRLRKDQRHKTISLTPSGQHALDVSKSRVWPGVETAVKDLLAGMEEGFLAQIDTIEARLAEKSLIQRGEEKMQNGLRIHEFSDATAPFFRSISMEWLEAMYSLEQVDRDILDHPREKIINKGGDILFVEVEGLGIVGACALYKTGDHQYELTKMGVLETARGRKAGEYLVQAIIARAKQKQAQLLYLLSNKKSAAAIHLYEKVGFLHDEDIMQKFGKRYARCDVAMRYPLA